ncbi:MAG: hypothetical protein K0Q91_975 [Fibrobacteria bacterium]|jgi:hypothetical protein|nr:hypothetical protein [Fibrobacteria bacterium]
MGHYKPGQASDETSGAGSPGIPFGVQLLALIAGIVIFVMGVESILQDYRVIRSLTHLDTEYKTMRGTWLQVKVRQDSSSSGKYYPDVLYEYFPEGKSVWGWRLSLEEHPKGAGYWEERLKNYKAGDTVTVHVRPEDPKDSFIEPRTDGIFRYLLKGLVGVGFCVFGGILVFIPLAGWLKKKKQD